MITDESIIKTVDKQEVMEGFTTWVNPINQFRIIDLEFTADPLKRNPEWITNSKKGITRAAWNREFGPNWVVYTGKPVYDDFDDTIHIVKGDIRVPRKSKLICGYDGGPNDVNLGWVLGIIVPMQDELAITFVDEYFVDDGDGWDFISVVDSRIKSEWAKIGGFMVHVADRSVFTKSSILERNKGASSLAEVMRLHGIHPIAGEVSVSGRRKSVIELLKHLSTIVDGKPIMRWRVHERCTMLIEAMRGGYHYPRNPTIYSTGGYKENPAKNKFSHIANAMEYACSKLADLNAYDKIPYAKGPLPRYGVI